MVRKKVLKKNDKMASKKRSSAKSQEGQSKDIMKFASNLLGVRETFKVFSKLNKSFLKNCSSSIKNYENLSKEYDEAKAKCLQEKRKCTKLSSLAKKAIQQNKKLRQMFYNAVKIIVSKNQVIKRLKKQQSNNTTNNA